MENCYYCGKQIRPDEVWQRVEYGLGDAHVKCADEHYKRQVHYCDGCWAKNGTFCKYHQSNRIDVYEKLCAKFNRHADKQKED